MPERIAPIEINKEEFRKIGYQLIDLIADFITCIKEKPVTTGESPKQLQALLGNASLPENGMPAEILFSRAGRPVI